MKVLHLSTHDTRGGAARATYCLHNALRQRGHESTLLVAEKHSDDPTVIAFQPSMDLLTRLRRRLRKERITRDFARYRMTRPMGLEQFSDDRSAYAEDIVNALPLCDIINLHWVAGFLDYQSFLMNVPQHTAVVWRLADMNVFTGGCHYDEGCGKFVRECGSCPQLGSCDSSDLSKRVWDRKRVAFDSVNPARLHIVATSRWLADQTKQSLLLGRFPVTIIPNMIDATVFAPRDRHFSRDALGLPRDAKVVLFVSDFVTNKRKGLALLAQAVEDLQGLGTVVLLTIGSGKPGLAPSIRHLHWGQISNDRFLSVIYSAADVFVIPSMQESFGLTVLESMACGTPVVGFAVGGIQDTVRHGTTGLLVPVADSVALRDAIIELLNDPVTCQYMGVEGRRIVLEEYADHRLAQKYVALYESMILK
jgi:glycosyltransferase involved in cell wall biosynthesis